MLLPWSVPFIAAGIRLAIGRGLVGMIIAEFFTSISGLGYMITRYTHIFEMDKSLRAGDPADDPRRVADRGAEMGRAAHRALEPGRRLSDAAQSTRGSNPQFPYPRPSLRFQHFFRGGPAAG